MSGKITKLCIAVSVDESMKCVNEIVVEEEKGIFGDRYYNEEGTFSKKGVHEADREVTLIEQENIDQFNKTYNLDFQYEDFRRNIVISNFDLNSLVDKEFQIGNVILKGMRLCQPCKHLSDKLDEKVMEGLVNKGGLRAKVIKSGNILLNSQLES